MDYKNIVFNKPYLTGKENHYIYDAVNNKGQLSGNGFYTNKCQEFLKDKYGFENCLLTTSCTDALEMVAILLRIQPGDEVIMPSYTFVSTANAFILRGAKIVFCDSRKDYPAIDEKSIKSLITDKTKAIVVVHYAGLACDMDYIMDIAEENKLFVVEDAAQAIDSYFESSNGEKKPLGSIGHLSTFSFHETKNIISGEGGALVINDSSFFQRAEIIWEKGTNRSSFFRGEVDKYGWVDFGSSFLPAELVSAFLYAQLENIDIIQNKRKEIWTRYFNGLKALEEKGCLELPKTPSYGCNNGHMFYLVCENIEQRTGLLKFLSDKKIKAVFHYQSLHKSEFFKDKYEGEELENSDRYSNCLVRLPMFFELENESIDRIIDVIKEYYTL